MFRKFFGKKKSLSISTKNKDKLSAQKKLNSKKSKNSNFHKINIQNYEEVVYVAKILFEQKRLAIDIQTAPPSDRKRIIDFLSGYVFALGGNARFVNSETYIFSLEK